MNGQYNYVPAGNDVKPGQEKVLLTLENKSQLVKKPGNCYFIKTIGDDGITSYRGIDDRYDSLEVQLAITEDKYKK